MKNPLDKRQKLLHNGARGTFQYFVKVCECGSVLWLSLSD